MNRQEWNFTLRAMSAARDWLEENYKGLAGQILFEHKDLHKDDDLDLTCILTVESTLPEVNNIVFYCKQALYGVKLAVYKRIDTV